MRKDVVMAVDICLAVLLGALLYWLWLKRERRAMACGTSGSGLNAAPGPGWRTALLFVGCALFAVIAPGHPIFVALGMIVFITVAVLVSLGGRFLPDSERLRRAELSTLARKLELRFRPGHDFELPRRYAFLDLLRRGDTRYAFNVLDGTREGFRVFIFDYHFAGCCSDNRGGAVVQHYYCSAFVLELVKALPELIITGENMGSRLRGALGKPDIGFESAEFSRAFFVHSTDRKFAYDVCNARMIEYLLANRDLTIRINRDVLVIPFESWLCPGEIEKHLARLINVRKLMPEYLFASSLA